MKFLVYSANRYNVSASLDDVVYFIRYHFEESGSSAISGVLNYESKHYHLMCDPVNSNDFLDYESLSTSSFKEWIKDSHGNNWGSFTSSIQTSLSNALSSRASEKPTEVYSWASGSHTLDSVAMSTGSIQVNFG